ncbi:MAG: hypothetical protein H6999_07460 [Hahellaceae bacterium]|nr:hypothetical protein [Hahellaceae bacterium]
MLKKMWQDWQRDRHARQRNQAKTTALLAALNDLPVEQQAGILALATVFRHKVIDRSQQLSDVIYSPEHNSPKKLRLVFELLEAIQERMQTEMQNVQKHLHDIPLIANQSPQAHWIHTMQSMDLWLITLGAALDKRQQPYAQQVWQILDASCSKLTTAIAALRDLEKASATKNEMYGDINDDDWIAMCAYRPDWLKMPT